MMRRLGIILSLLACTPLAYGSNVTLTAQCSQVSVNDYLWAGHAADDAPEKIYKFVELKKAMVDAVKGGDASRAGCLGQIWEQGLKEQADYVADRLKAEHCQLDEDLHITGGCDKNGDAAKAYAASDRFVHNLQDDKGPGGAVQTARAGADADIAAAQREVRAAEQAVAHASADANKANCPQADPITSRADAKDFLCCGAKGGDAEGFAGGSIGDLHPELKYAECISQTRPSQYSVYGVGALECVSSGVKGWLSGFINALTGPFKLVGALWGARSQIWGLMSSSAARSKFESDMGQKIEALFTKISDKGTAATCYNHYEQEQALCHFIGAVLGTLAAPDAFGMLLSLAGKAIGKSADILEGFLSKSASGQRALNLAKAAKNVVVKVKNDVKGRVGDRINRIKDKTPEGVLRTLNAAKQRLAAAKQKLAKLEDARKKINAVQYAIPKAIISKTYRNELFAKLRGAVTNKTEVAGASGAAGAISNQASEAFSAQAAHALATDDAAAARNAFGVGKMTPFKNRRIETAANAQHMAIERSEQAGTLTPEEAVAKHEEIAKAEALATGNPQRSWTKTNLPVQAADAAAGAAQPSAGAAAAAKPAVAPKYTKSQLDQAQASMTEFGDKMNAYSPKTKGAVSRASFDEKTTAGIHQEAVTRHQDIDELLDAKRITPKEAARLHTQVSEGEAAATRTKLKVYVRPEPSGAVVRVADPAETSAQASTAHANVTSFSDRAANVADGDAKAARAALEVGRNPVFRGARTQKAALAIHQDIETSVESGEITRAEGDAKHADVTRIESIATKKPAASWVRSNEPVAPAEFHAKESTPDLAAAKTQVDTFNHKLQAASKDGELDRNGAKALFNSKTSKGIHSEALGLHMKVDALQEGGQLWAGEAEWMHGQIDTAEAQARGLTNAPKYVPQGERQTADQLRAAREAAEPKTPADTEGGRPLPKEQPATGGRPLPKNPAPSEPVAGAPAKSSAPLNDIGMRRPSLQLAKGHVGNFLEELRNMPKGTDIVDARKNLFLQTDRVGVLREVRELHAEVDQLQEAGEIIPATAKRWHARIAQGEVRATGQGAQKWTPFKSEVWTGGEPPTPSAELPASPRAADPAPPGPSRVATLTAKVRKQLSDFNAAAKKAFASSSKYDAQQALGVGRGVIRREKAAQKAAEAEHAKIESLGLSPEETAAEHEKISKLEALATGQPERPFAPVPKTQIEIARSNVNGFMDEYKALTDGATKAQARQLFDANVKKGWTPWTRNRNQIAATLEESQALHGDINVMHAKGDITDEQAQQMHQTVAHAEALATGKPPAAWTNEVPAEPQAAAAVEPAAVAPAPAPRAKGKKVWPLAYMAAQPSKPKPQPQLQSYDDQNRDPQSVDEPTVDFDQLFGLPASYAPRSEIPDDATDEAPAPAAP